MARGIGWVCAGGGRSGVDAGKVGVGIGVFVPFKLEFTELMAVSAAQWIQLAAWAYISGLPDTVPSAANLDYYRERSLLS